MKLTEHVKKYIEENIDLIDNMTTDSALKFLDGFDPPMAHQEDLACIREVLCNTLSVLPDMHKQINDYKKELDLAYDSEKSINILNLQPELTTDWDCDETTRWAMEESFITLNPPTRSKKIRTCVCYRRA